MSPFDHSSTAGILPRRCVAIILLLFAASFLNYIDRQVLSVLKPVIKTEFAIDDQGYALVVNVFTFCYAAAYIGTGWAVDRFGVRGAYAFFIGLWSLASIGAGFSKGLSMFTGFRGLLGLAEPAHAPVTVRVGGLWFPQSRRAFLMSIASLGGTLGSVAAPPLIAWIALTWSWRVAFVAPGLIGLGVALLWWKVYRDPAARPEATTTIPEPLPWRKIWGLRALWGVVLVRLVSDPVLYFCLFWMPGYLQEQRGLSLKQAGMVGWIPFMAANVGALVCAALSDRMASEGNPRQARLRLLMGLSCLAPLALLVPHLAGLPAAITLLSIIMVVSMGWFAILGPLLIDIFPGSNASSVWAIAGAFGAVGAMVFNYSIGRVTSSLGTEQIFLVLGLLHPLALGILLLSLRKPVVTASG
jgi:ACS family hexuronate transporter-like MFS transporter